MAASKHLPPRRSKAAAPFPGGAFAKPVFNLNECVEYRWAAGGEFVGEARIVEVLPDRRYRLERLDGASFPREGSILVEEQLRLKPPEPVV